MQRDMTPHEVKEAIRQRGKTLTELGVEAGFSAAAVSIALRKRAPFVQQLIADFLGMKPQDIWPSRYDANGSPIRIDPRGRRLTHPPIGNSGQQKRSEAA